MCILIINAALSPLNVTSLVMAGISTNVAYNIKDLMFISDLMSFYRFVLFFVIINALYRKRKFRLHLLTLSPRTSVEHNK